jgi:hypothetical protein
MSHIIDLKKKDEEKKPKEEVKEPLAPVVQPEPLPPVEDHVMQPQLVEYEADTLYHEWKAPEFTHHEKDKKWYLYVGVGTVALVTLAAFFSSGLTALLFGLFGVVFLFMGNQKPRDIGYSISPLGIQIGEKHHQFSEFESFWIHYTPEIQEVSLKSKKLLSPYIKVSLENQDPIHIREMLTNYLTEEFQEEEITDLLLRRIKF